MGWRPAREASPWSVRDPVSLWAEETRPWGGAVVCDVDHAWNSWPWGAGKQGKAGQEGG